MKCCNHELEFAYTIDKTVPGNIVSTAVFKCRICGEEFNEWEIENANRESKCSNTDNKQ